MPDIYRRPWFPYVAPFAVFMVFTACGQYMPALAHLFYVLKTVVTGLLLLVFRNEYRHDLAGCISLKMFFESALAGLAVLAAWILFDGLLPTIGTPAGFDPSQFGLSGSSKSFILVVRLLGAALIVPIMEELFWRSFLMRYLIYPNFRAVRVGTFTWFSFLAVTILFGLEHFRIVLGLMAGAVFGLLVIHQKNIKGAIISHGITNLGLGLYVLSTGSWNFW